MTTKLTLTVEESVIKKAKKYARKSGRSLSNIIEVYLSEMVEDTPASNLSPKLKKIKGAIKLPAHFDEKKALRKNLEIKHL